MRRQVLGAQNAPKRKADGGFYSKIIISFLGIYLLLQLFLWASHDGAGIGSLSVIRNAVRFARKEGGGGSPWSRVLGNGGGERAAAAAGGGGGGGAAAEATEDGGSSSRRAGAPAAVFFGASESVGSTLVESTGSNFVAQVTDGGPGFEWSSLDKEPPYPSFSGNEDAIPIITLRPDLASVGAAWEEKAREIKAAAEEAARAEGKDPLVAAAAAKLPPRGAGDLYDSMSVTIGHPCWASPRMLYSLGLDSMATYLSDAPPPRDLFRSRLPHPLAPLASDMHCVFHSTPIQGGLQCCCHSNLSLAGVVAGKTQDPADGPGPDGATFFCLPSLTIAGARNTGAGRLYALFHQHAYLVTAPAPPPHVHSSITNRLLVDGIMPRYAAHYARQTPAAWQRLPTFKERNKAVSDKYSIDASPSYFYATHASLMLRKLIPRGKVIVLLRDTVDRGYTDLVRFLAASKGREAEEALLGVVHGCFRDATCGAREGAGGGGAGVAADRASWATRGASRFAACVAGALPAVPALAAAAQALAGDGGAPALACLAETAGPAGHADWGAALGALTLADRDTPPVPCADVGADAGAAAATPGTPLYAEARRMVRSALRQAQRKILVGCVPLAALGRDHMRDLAEVSQADVLAGIRRARGVLAGCTAEVAPGTAVAVPTDLLAGVVAGYDLNLVEVSADFPKGAAAPGAVLEDNTDACFPGGLEGLGPDSEAHALARSMYLRPLQRMHAAYGKSVPMLFDSTSLKTRPLNVLDPILNELNVYKPVLEPSKTKAAAAKLAWRGEEAEADTEPAGSLPEMSEEVAAELVALYTPYDAALRVYLGAEHSAVVRSWRTTKAAGGAAEEVVAAEEEPAAPKKKGGKKRVKK